MQQGGRRALSGQGDAGPLPLHSSTGAGALLRPCGAGGRQPQGWGRASANLRAATRKSMMPMLAADAASGHRSSPSSSVVFACMQPAPSESADTKSGRIGQPATPAAYESQPHGGCSPAQAVYQPLRRATTRQAPASTGPAPEESHARRSLAGAATARCPYTHTAATALAR